MPASNPTPGIVLSGGGMRGAYEAGVVAGIMEVLGRRASGPPTFRVFSGTSVGAINAAFLAANSHRADHAVGELAALWTGLKLEENLRLRPLGLMRLPRRGRLWLERSGWGGPGTSLIDARRIERTVKEAVDWKRLHENVGNGNVRALLIAALHVLSGQTTVFAELTPGATFPTSKRATRTARFEPISADHVLASAAIPLLFPTRNVNGRFYCDGGLRFNTPIAPAIRVGADRLVIISLSHQKTELERETLARELDEVEGKDLGALFLVGKLLNALLLDPVRYEIHVLERLNQILEVLRATLTQEEYERFQRVLVTTRGAPYRRIPSIVFTPSEDLGALAGEYLRTSLRSTELNAFVRTVLERAAKEGLGREADWASYLLFDGGFAGALIALGRQDAHAKALEIRELFEERGDSTPP